MPTRRRKPLTRWRDGDRDPAARRAHNTRSREWRRELSEAVMNAGMRARLLGDIARVGSVVEVAESYGVSPSMVWGRARWDTKFARNLDIALARNCRGKPYCGRPQGYRQGGRCAKCRHAHWTPQMAADRRQAGR